jgi:hypothetical protein
MQRRFLALFSHVSTRPKTNLKEQSNMNTNTQGVSATPTTLETPTPAPVAAVSPATAVVASPVTLEAAVPVTTEASSPKKAKGKRVEVKTKPNKDSVRPNSANATENDQKQGVVVRTLIFSIPSKDGIACVQEFAGASDLAVDLAQAGDVPVKSVGFTNNAWEIALDLAPIAGSVAENDEILNTIFRLINPTIEASAIMRKGYLPQARPSWKYTIRKNFVPDFVSETATL